MEHGRARSNMHDSTAGPSSLSRASLGSSVYSDDLTNFDGNRNDIWSHNQRQYRGNAGRSQFGANLGTNESTVIISQLESQKRRK